MSAEKSPTPPAELSPNQGGLPKLVAPAQRALAAAGITHLDQLAHFSVDELKQLHGIGPNALETLRRALEEHDLSFAKRP